MTAGTRVCCSSPTRCSAAAAGPDASSRANTPGWTPDILVLGKGLTSGFLPGAARWSRRRTWWRRWLPISGTASRSRTTRWSRRSSGRSCGCSARRAWSSGQPSLEPMRSGPRSIRSRTTGRPSHGWWVRGLLAGIAFDAPESARGCPGPGGRGRAPGGSGLLVYPVRGPEGQGDVVLLAPAAHGQQRRTRRDRPPPAGGASPESGGSGAGQAAPGPGSRGGRRHPRRRTRHRPDAGRRGRHGLLHGPQRPGAPCNTGTNGNDRGNRGVGDRRGRPRHCGAGPTTRWRNGGGGTLHPHSHRLPDAWTSW